MNEERILKKLAAAARADLPPRIDVSGQVLERLVRRSQPRRLALWAFAATSSAAAAAVTLLAVHVSAARQDLFGEFLQSILAVLR